MSWRAGQPFVSLLMIGAGLWADTPVTITSTSLPDAVIGRPYSAGLSASGPHGPFTWRIQVGALPSGLALSADGQISGTASTIGVFQFTVTATNTRDQTGSAQLAISVTSPVVINTASLPNGQVGSAYAQSLQTSGGRPPYTWSLAGGALPGGLVLNGGQINGTPTAAGTAQFTVRVTDSAGSTATKSLSITIGAGLAITACPAGPALVGQAYSSVAAASGGSPPYTWSASGTLPPGLALNRNSGALSGTPTQAGAFAFTLAVSDLSSATATKACSINVGSALTITTVTLPAGDTSAAFAQQLSASGGTPPYTWSISAGALPAGLTLSAAGLISGRAGQAGTFVFTVRATDSTGGFVERSFSLLVTSLMTITCPPATAFAGQPYSASASVAGGQSPYSWSAALGLPAGLALSTNGQLAGIPSDLGTFLFTLIVTDRNNSTATQQCTLTVASNLVIANVSLPDASISTQYSQTLNVTGGRAPCTWGIGAGTLPAGLTLSAAGVISGFPSQTGLYSFTLNVADASGVTAQKTFSINVLSGLIVAACPANVIEIGLPLNNSLAATGGSPPYTWSISGGSLPAGLTLDSANGVISGTPTQAGSVQFTVMALDALNRSATRQCSMDVRSSLVISTGALAAGFIGTEYLDTLMASGGQTPYVWSKTAGSLPPGLSLNATSGQISGKPSVTGTFSFTVHVIDALGAKNTKDLGITITPGLLITDCPTQVATIGLAYSASLVATGGTAPYQWRINSGALPAGLALDSANASISGIPMQVASASYVLQATDASSQTATRACSIQVNSAALAITSAASLPDATVGVQYSQTLAASGGRPPYSWSVVNPGTAPQGLSLAASGTLTGIPATPGAFSFAVQVADQDNNFVRQTLVINILAGRPPDITIAGLPDVVDPAAQPAFGLQLDTPYPADLRGSITLTFVPDATVGVDDPAVQFATGGRTLVFTIPANTVTFSFAAPVVALQTGTVAGTIQLAVSVQSGGIDITGPGQPVRAIHVGLSAPKIVSLSMLKTSDGIELHLIGFATSRQVSQGTFRFRPANGGQPIEITVPMSDSGGAWFKSPQSMQFGGQFSLVQPFTLREQLSTFSSVSVMLSNLQGTSNPMTIAF